MHHLSRGSIMRNHRLVFHDTSLTANGQLGLKSSSILRCVSDSFPFDNILKSKTSRAIVSCHVNQARWDFVKSARPRNLEAKCVANLNNTKEISDEDDVCPVECVKEFTTDDEFLGILEKSKRTKSLVVVDFYRTACGSCKYIEKIFTKLCKGSGAEDAEVIFLKHNVIDEYDEQSEVAERLRIKVVPLFHFYKDGVLLEAFPTRDKEKIIEAIHKYTAPISQDH